MLALTAVASRGPGHHRAGAGGAPPRPSLNLYGVTGLIDMPSAEAQPDAQVSASYSQFGKTARRNFTFQLLPRISATVRYSTISDWGNADDPGLQPLRPQLRPAVPAPEGEGLAAVAGARLPRRPRHRGLFGASTWSPPRPSRGTSPSPAASAGGGWPASAGSRTRSARSPTASAPATIDFGRGRERRASTRCSTARRWASSAASSGGPRSTS